MVKIDLLTQIENKVLNKKLNNKRLNQIEANYLSRAIRPKLRKLEKLNQINIPSILKKIEYNQKGRAIELKIKKLTKESITNLDSIIIYGSAIQTNYHSYKDIDVLIITKKRSWDKEKEKYALIKTIKEKVKNLGLILDIQIIDRKTFYLEYSSSPDLVYQLKDCKIIYGNIKIPKKISFSKLDLQMKLDWSNINNINPEATEIYKALRNAVLVKLLLSKIVDNQRLNDGLYDETGRNIVEKLKNNNASNIERKIALNYLNELSEKIREDIKGGSWEKIEL
jgi:predicted nucleotidyltransferase